MLSDVIYSIISPNLINFDDESISKIIGDLKDTGGIEDIKITIQGDNLTILISEYPIISKVNFINNERFKKNEIFEFIDVSDRLNYYNTENINDYIDEIKNLYMSFGYNKISIDYEKIKTDSENVYDLNFTFNENKISKINKISFLGNNNFNKNSLMSIIKSNERNYLKFSFRNNFKLYEAKNDIIRLKQFYLSKGYKDIQVNLKTEFIDKKNKFNIFFYLDEGDQYSISNIKLNFPDKFLDKNLIDEMNIILNDYNKNIINKGSIYNNNFITKIKDNLTNYLFDNGIMFFDIRTLEKIHKLDVDIILDLKKIQPKFASQINIFGNTRTLDSVIRREVEFSEGDQISTYLLQKTSKNLNRLNFFESTDIKQTKIDSEKSVIDIYVKEKPTGDFKIGASFGSLSGPSFVTGLSEKNYGGKGRNLDLTVDTSKNNTVYSLDVLEPYVFNKKLNYLYGLDYSQKKYKSTGSYNVDRLDLKNGFNYYLVDDLLHSVVLRYTLKNYKVTNSSSVASSILNNQGTNAEISLTNGFTLDKLNSFIRPTNGNYYLFQNKIAQKNNYSETYIKNLFIFKKYNKIDKNILSFQSKIGNLTSLGSKEILSDNKFSLGGRWLRGFDSFGAGPRDSQSSYIGAKNLAVIKADISRPIIDQSDNPIDLNLFFDAGKLWDNKNSPIFSEESIRSSYGLGLKFYTPVGPVGLSWAFPLSSESYDNKRMFLFSIGNLN